MKYTITLNFSVMKIGQLLQLREVLYGIGEDTDDVEAWIDKRTREEYPEEYNGHAIHECEPSERHETKVVFPLGMGGIV